MPALVDRTSEFRQKVQECDEALPPDAKRRKLTKPRKEKGSDDGQPSGGDTFLVEAYTILNHITTLTKLLASVRRPYLNVDSNPVFHSAPRSLDLSSAGDGWAGIRHLTNEERDQIDLQAKIILTRCAERVRDLETSEKRRIEATSNKSNSLLRLIPSRLLVPTDSSTSSDFLAAHHSNITWYLTRRMADASQTQKEMQEERIKRQMERAKTLGSQVSEQAAHMAMTDSFTSPRASSSTTALSRSMEKLPPPVTYDAELDDDSDDDDMELSTSQILQFEQENAAILRQVEDVLQSVQLAEARLLDISALQSQLVAQLTRQTEVVEQLYDEAIASQAEVEKGNAQLKQAKERARESRKMLLVFILGATMAILFLHWYD